MRTCRWSRVLTIVVVGLTGQVFGQTASPLVGTAVVRPVNHLSNSGFENGLNGWTDLWGPPTSIVPVPHTGSYSAGKTVTTVTGQDFWSQTYQEAAWNPGQPLYAALYVQTTFAPAAAAKAGLLVEFLDLNNQTIGSTVKGIGEAGGTTSWRLVQASVPAAPAGTVKARLSCYLWALQDDSASLSGTAYYDDALLAKIYKPIPPQSQLFNPGFENGLHDWQELFGAPSTLTTDAQTGVYAAQKQIPTVAGQDYWSQIHQKLGCQPGQQVSVSMGIKTEFDVTAQARAGVMVEFLDADSQVIGTPSKTSTGAQTPWTTVSLTNLTAPTGTVRVRSSGYIFAPMGDVPSVNGVAKYDNFSVTIQ